MNCAFSTFWQPILHFLLLSVQLLSLYNNAYTAYMSATHGVYIPCLHTITECIHTNIACIHTYTLHVYTQLYILRVYNMHTLSHGNSTVHCCV